MSSIKDLRKDPVFQLIIGRFEKIPNKNGTFSETFVPSKRNPYPTLSNIERVTDLSREQILVQEGLVYPRSRVNREEFQKTYKERMVLRSLKKNLGKPLLD